MRASLFRISLMTIVSLGASTAARADCDLRFAPPEVHAAVREHQLRNAETKVPTQAAAEQLSAPLDPGLTSHSAVESRRDDEQQKIKMGSRLRWDDDKNGVTHPHRLAIP